MSQDINIQDKLKENRSDYYGSKFSEHIFEQGKVTDSNKKELDEEMNTKMFWNDIDIENDYNKKNTLSKF
jgi:hypothetical protein